MFILNRYHNLAWQCGAHPPSGWPLIWCVRVRHEVVNVAVPRPRRGRRRLLLCQRNPTPGVYLRKGSKGSGHDSAFRVPGPFSGSDPSSGSPLFPGPRRRSRRPIVRHSGFRSGARGSSSSPGLPGRPSPRTLATRTDGWVVRSGVTGRRTWTTSHVMWEMSPQYRGRAAQKNSPDQAIRLAEPAPARWIRSSSFHGYRDLRAYSPDRPTISIFHG